MSKTLIELENLKKHFPIRKGILGFEKKYVKSVDGVSFDVKEGEVFGLVGESGCGKSTTGKLICKLLDSTSGKIIFDGVDITDFDRKKMRDVRKKVQMVFQDPYASIDPRMTIGEIVAEPILIHKLCKSKEDLRNKVMETLKMVGLDTYHAARYPHELSGGQRQRVGIATALAVNPKLIIADEPVSALDVSIQSQVLNLMSDLKDRLKLTYIFISHDLSVVGHISDRVGVMYLGNIVEVSDKKDIYENPLHPYTKALLSSIPVPNPRAKRKRVILKGEIPSPVDPPSGCKFHTRCPECMEICKKIVPEKIQVNDSHYVYCHLYDKK